MAIGKVEFVCSQCQIGNDLWISNCVVEVEEMKRQMEEELRKKEEELENLTKSYEQRMADKAVSGKVSNNEELVSFFIIVSIDFCNPNL